MHLLALLVVQQQQSLSLPWLSFTRAVPMPVTEVAA